MDRGAVLTLGNNGFNACQITSLMFKVKSLPSVDAAVEQIAYWSRYWHSIGPDTRKDVTQAWREIRDQLKCLPFVSRWSKVFGGIGATITTLLEVGWTPISAMVWHDETNGEVAILGSSPFSDGLIVHAFREACMKVHWAMASEHFAGDGLEQGPPSFCAIASLRK